MSPPQKPGACPACGTPHSDGDVRVAGIPVHTCPKCHLRFCLEAERPERVDYERLYQADGLYNHMVDDVDRLVKGELLGLTSAARMAMGHIREIKPRSVLDVGCGTGWFLAHVQRLGIEVAGVEPSATGADGSRRHIHGDIRTGYLSPETFPGRTFDVITAWEVIEHVHDLHGFLRVIDGYLAPGGWLIMSTPNYSSRWMWDDMPHDPESRPPVHVSFFDRGSLKTLLDAHFATNAIRQTSMPFNGTSLAGGSLAKPRIIVECLVRPSARRTLLSLSQKAGS